MFLHLIYYDFEMISKKPDWGKFNEGTKQVQQEVPVNTELIAAHN